MGVRTRLAERVVCLAVVLNAVVSGCETNFTLVSSAVEFLLCGHGVQYALVLMVSSSLRHVIFGIFREVGGRLCVCGHRQLGALVIGS